MPGTARWSRAASLTTAPARALNLTGLAPKTPSPKDEGCQQPGRAQLEAELDSSALIGGGRSSTRRLRRAFWLCAPFKHRLAGSVTNGQRPAENPKPRSHAMSYEREPHHHEQRNRMSEPPEECGGLTLDDHP